MGYRYSQKLSKTHQALLYIVLKLTDDYPLDSSIPPHFF